MTVNRKVTGTAVSMPAGIAIGCVVSLLLTLAGSSLAAKLISDEILKETAIGYGSMLIVLLASALGAVTAILRVKRRYLQVCLLSGVSYYGLLLCITALFFGGQYQGMGVTAMLVLAGVGSVVLLGTKEKKTKNFRKGRK